LAQLWPVHSVYQINSAQHFSNKILQSHEQACKTFMAVVLLAPVHRTFLLT